MSGSGTSDCWRCIAAGARQKLSAHTASCAPRLIDHLGIEPGPELRELETQILRQDPTLDYRRVPPGRDNAATPQTRYVESGGVHIAYQVVGEGERDLLFVPGLMSHLELAWDDPGTASFYRRLASLGRLILFDKRDTGLSDRAPRDSPLEERMQDVQAVMDAVSSDRAVVFGYSEGAPMSILFAATYPEKVSSLILGSAFARWFPAPDYPCGPGAEVVYAAMHEIATDRWGQGATIDWFLPSRASSTRTRQALARFERMAISPSAFLRMLRMISEIDVRAALPAIGVPTLVIQRLGDRINPPFYGRYIATHIPGARYFEQPGDHVLRFAQGQELVDLFDEIEEFLATTPPSRDRPACSPRSCSRSGQSATGQRPRKATWMPRWRHQPRALPPRSSARKHRTSILATFDAPGQAIRCAAAIRADAAAHGIQLAPESTRRSRPRRRRDQRHLRRDRHAHRGAREAGEILVSRTVKDLVVGSGISFAHRGTHQLGAIPGQWQLFAVTTPQG